MKSTVLIFWSIATIILAEDCVPRKFRADRIVCVCNSTYCDGTTVEIPPTGQFQVYTSSESGLRLYSEAFNFERNSNLIKLLINTQKTYQSIWGFGGAFTDSAGINIKSLSEGAQDKLLETYFGKYGSNYNLGRVPVGGTDFSTRPYTLDDHNGDITLSNFSLAREDNDYKITYMQKAREINPELRFLASSWTAPPWMKTNNDYTGFLGFLKKDCYQIYAEYLIKFLETYKKNGLPIWAITTGNEPADVFVPLLKLNDMGWTPDTVTDWVINNLGPTLAKSTSNDTLIIALDDQRLYLPWYIKSMYFHNGDIDKYISGIAVHWYSDAISPVEVFDTTHSAFPNKFLIMSEACTGSAPWDLEKVSLGSWDRGERYILSIIEDLNHWVTAWIDWNLALDKHGGPNWIDNYVDSPIIVNAETDEFFKQPMYYALAHFSKFIPRGSVRVDLTDDKKIKSTAFITPDNTIVIVLYNPNRSSEDVSIVDPNQGNINVKLSGRTIKTIIYKQ